MLLKITIRDLVLVSLLGATSALVMLSTIFFHALIPIPGFGGIVSIPLATACMLIARDRVSHPMAAGLTKTVQYLVLFFLPAGPPWFHVPLFIPFLILEGFLLDIFVSLRKQPLSDAGWWRCGLLCLIAGSVCIAAQGGASVLLLENASGLMRRGIKGFIFLFLGLHGLLRFIGGSIGWIVLSSIPRRQP